jgi:hypothetical protein
MCTVHYTVHLESTLSLSFTYKSKEFNVGTGTKEDESSTGRVWAAVFHHVRARSLLARVLKSMNRSFV